MPFYKANFSENFDGSTISINLVIFIIYLIKKLLGSSSGCFHIDSVNINI